MAWTSVQNSWTMRFVPPVFLASLRKVRVAPSSAQIIGENEGMVPDTSIVTRTVCVIINGLLLGIGGTHQEFDRLADDG